MKTQNEIDRDLLDKLMQIDNPIERNPQKMHDGLTAFLKEAETYIPTITNQSNKRHIGWNASLKQFFTDKRKEFSPMSTILTILLATSLLFGASGVTLAAAQNSMPEEALYGLKLLSEDTRLDLINDPTIDFQLSLEFMGRRAEEIQQMLNAGDTPSDDLLMGYQRRVEKTLRFALNQTDNQVEPSLELVRSRLVIHQQNFQQLQNTGLEGQIIALTKIQAIIQTRIAWANVGVNDPDSLLINLQNHSGVLDTSIDSAGNPWTTGTPTPGSSYGPGTGESITNTPKSYDHSENPYTTGTPTPGSGYGPGYPDANGNLSTQPGYKPEDSGPGYDSTQIVPNQPTNTGNKGGNK